MKYFITGATGFIGGQIAEQLLEAGHDVTALVRNEGRAGHLKKLGAKITTGDITDKESMRAPMTGVDGVFHIAAWYKIGAKNKNVAEKINVNGTRNVLELVQELGIKKSVYTSTLAVFSDTHGKLVDESYRYDGPHLSEYDRTKWLAHYQVALPKIKNGLPLVIVQPGAVYGPGDTSRLGKTFKDYLLKKLPAVPRGVNLCWAHVDDTARGHILAMEKGGIGESYIIAGPPHTLEEMFLTAEKITGIKPPKMRLAPGMLKFMSKLTGALSFLPLPESYTAESLRVVAGTSYLGSNEKAKRELGYAPRPLQEGLRETLEYMIMNDSVISFHNIYQRYAQDVYRYSFWLCGDADEAKDFTSETFIRLWTAKDDLRVETVKAYLFTIARNLFLQKKRNHKHVVKLDVNLVDSAPGADKVTEARSELQNVLNALQILPEVDRSALIMRAYEDLSYQEIARLLGLSVSATKVKIHRARLKLAKKLKSEEYSFNGSYR